MHRTWFAFVCASGPFLLGCGQDELEGGGESPSPHACDASAEATRTVSCVESFEPGEAAGFGTERYPEVIYGLPLGNGETQGGIDVLSLGRQGVLTVGFGGNTILDGPGVDFVVFENPFVYGSMSDKVFSELGEVSVSSDGETWVTFPCAAESTPPLGCAGYAPVFANGDLGISAFDPAVSGGDFFDLNMVGVSEARFVRIRDVQGAGAAPTAGFDLDAVAIVHAEVP